MIESALDSVPIHYKVWGKKNLLLEDLKTFRRRETKKKLVELHLLKVYPIFMLLWLIDIEKTNRKKKNMFISKILNIISQAQLY